MTLLALRDLCFSAGGKAILRHVDLDVPKGEFLTILGPSGSGKTSLLLSVAGFNRVTSGTIALAGRDITAAHPRARNFGVVFQSYALFPHYNVADNLAFPLRIRNAGETETRKRVAEVAELVGLGEHLAKRPAQLSGGQQQRVALGRALIYRPDIILLDEPLSALDVQLRGRMQGELVRIHRETGATIINVTHDQQEALSVSTRVVVMNEGEVVEDASPADIYHRPKTSFTAGFIGDSNIIEVAQLRQEMAQGSADPDAWSFLSSSSTTLIVKPEHLSFRRPAAQALLLTRGRIAERRFAGEITHYIVTSPLGDLRLKIAEAQDSKVVPLGATLPVYVFQPALQTLV